MHQMRHIGNRLQRHLGTAESAAALPPTGDAPAATSSRAGLCRAHGPATWQYGHISLLSLLIVHAYARSCIEAGSILQRPGQAEAWYVACISGIICCGGEHQGAQR